MNINSLPDLCLVIIFSRVPLRDRLRSGHVCTKWRLIRSIVFSKRRCLTILVGKNAFDLIQSSTFDYPLPFSSHLLNDDGTRMFKPKLFCEWSSLKLNLLETKAVVDLANLFPNIHQLTIAMTIATDSNQLLLVAFLFELFSDKLVNLKMFCDLDCDYIPRFISRQLFNSINSMYSLKHLTLEFKCPFSVPWCVHFSNINSPNFVILHDTTSVDLSIISRLDEFNFYSADEERGDVMFDALQRHAQNSQRPLRIQYGYSEMGEYLYKLDQFDLQFCRRFTHLVSPSMPLVPSRAGQLITFCTRFSSLTNAHFEVIDNTLRYFLRSFAQLTQLVHLKLNIWFNTILPDESSDLLPQLPSVKSLDLHIFQITDHNNISLLNLPWTFPNVQVMALYVDSDMARCNICEYNQARHQIGGNRKDVLEHCLQQLMIPLRECTRLHTVTKFDAPPFEAAKLPLTKQDLMHTIELKYATLYVG